MNPAEARYSKSVYLFPCIDVSEELNSLKQLNVLVLLGRDPKIFFNNELISEIKTRTENYQIEWYGDCVEIWDPYDNKFFFIGFKNNFLIGFGSKPFKIEEKILKKEKIEKLILRNLLATMKINEEPFKVLADGFILNLPYKKYKPQVDLINKFETMKSDNKDWDIIRAMFKAAYSWKNRAPKLNDEDIKKIWEDSWVLYRINAYNPEGPFKNIWMTPCRHTDYQYDKLAMWDTLHMVEDLKWYKPDAAVKLLEMQFDLYRQSDGMIAQDRSCGDELDGANDKLRVNGSNFIRSQPPMWSYTFLELSKMVGDYKICGDAFDRMAKNVKWWEENRYFPEFRLFGYNMTPDEIGKESGLDNSPRFYNQFNGKNWRKCNPKNARKLITVDLNAQMADYYQNLGVIANMREDERCTDYFAKAERLIEDIQMYLWDDDEHFFFDFDIDMNCKQPIYASSHFWTLFGGCVLKGKLEAFVGHLTNPNKFWTELPVPTVAIDSPFYEDDMWSGPTWISQNYWIIIGLKRYNYGNLAAQLAKKCIKYISNSYFNYLKFYEFYNPKSLSQRVLKRKGKFPGPPADYVGHLPIHALYYYGILGAEILDEGINFIPHWNHIPKNMDFTFYYDNKKQQIEAKKGETKIIEILRTENK